MRQLRHTLRYYWSSLLLLVLSLWWEFAHGQTDVAVLLAAAALLAYDVGEVREELRTDPRKATRHEVS